MADNNVLKGMWCFNNTITFDASTNFTVNFICNIQNEKTQCTGITLSPSGTWLIYLMTDNSYIAHDGSRWTTESTKTIVITDETEQTAGLLAWLQTNATKVDDSFYTELGSVNDYLYNISRLQTNMQELIIAEGGTIQYKSIEQYMQSLINLRKKFVELLAKFNVEASESEKMGVAWANKFKGVMTNFLTDNVVDFYDDTITQISGAVFAYRNKLETVEMTELVQISGPVFMYASSQQNQYKKPSLTKVVMPKLKQIIATHNNFIGVPAFAYQKNLKEIDMPLLESIGLGAFTGTGLVEVNLPNLIYCGESTTYTSFKVGAFENCLSLENVFLPICEWLYYAAFRGCTLLKSVNLPKPARTGQYTFYGCTSLESVSMPLLTYIENYAFYNCTKLSAFDFSNITSIDGYAFYNTGLTGEIILPLCTGISGYAFQNNKNITKIIAPELTTLSNLSVNTSQINSYTFSGCTSLVEVDMPKLSKTGSKGASYTFTGCTALKVVNLPLLPAVYLRMFENCTALEEIDLPSALSAEQYAFYNCTALKTIKLNALTNLGQSVFSGCTSLETIELRSLISVPGQSISVPSLKEIYLDLAETFKQNTFSGSTSLKKVYMPKITELPNQVFYNTGDLSETDFSNIMTLTTYVFRNSKIINATFSSLTTMSNNNFQGCTNLLTFEAPVLETMSVSNFSGCTSLQTAHLGKISKLPTYTFEKCTALTDIYLGYDGLVTLEGTTAFTGTSNQQPITVHVKSEYVDLYTNATNWSYLIKGSYNMAKITIVGDYSD